MKRLILIPLFLLLAPGSAGAQGAAGLAKRLAALRTEVDDLAERRREQRKALRIQLASLRAERADLDRRLRLEGVRAKSLSQISEQRRAATAKIQQQMVEWLAPVKAAVKLVQQHVDATLPFQRAARHKVLRAIASDLAGAHPDPADALTRLWRFVEEESGLTQDTSIMQQAIDVGGTRVLAEVARLAMAMLYARLPDGRFAWAIRSNNSWRFEVLSGTAAQGVRMLFDAFAQNRRYGRVPLVVPANIEKAGK